MTCTILVLWAITGITYNINTCSIASLYVPHKRPDGCNVQLSSQKLIRADVRCEDIIKRIVDDNKNR